jgi:predicted nucleic acid-binding protein
VKGGVLVDTGPLVAILSLNDTHHIIGLEQLRHLSPPLLTCWPVITEAAWLLRSEVTGIQRLFMTFNQGEESMPYLSEFLFRYRSLGAQLADAALVCLAEREGIETVFTLDRRDFSVYRLQSVSNLARRARVEMLQRAPVVSYSVPWTASPAGLSRRCRDYLRREQSGVIRPASGLTTSFLLMFSLLRQPLAARDQDR